MSTAMVMQLMGGLALFLYGMKMMGEGLEKAAGNKLRLLLDKLTSNPFLAIVIGTVFTMAIQSSSATTVMVVGFCNAGLIDLLQATNVIFGANIGTTVTAWIVAGFKATVYMPLVLLIGIAMIMFIKKQKLQRIGQIIAGFGMLFVGMDMMSAATKPLTSSAEFTSLMAAFSNPFMATMIGLVITMVIQSSAAAIVILEMFVMQGLIPLQTSLFIIIGTNIGTCVTAMLSSVGASRSGRRAAWIHLLFNILSTVIVFVLLLFLPTDRWLMAMSDDTTLQIAVAHTVIKLFSVAVFLPLRGLLVKLSELVVRGSDPAEEERKLRYLDDRILSTPPIAVAQIIKEVNRMGEMAVDNLERAMTAFFTCDTAMSEEVAKTEETVNFLNREITRYMVAASKLDLPADDAERMGTLFHVINDLERIGDHASGIAEYTVSRVDEEIPFSEDGIAELHDILDKTLTLSRLALHAFNTDDRALLTQVLVQEENIKDLEKELQQNHVERLTVGACTPRSGMIFTDLVSNIVRVADHALNIGFSIDA